MTNVREFSRRRRSWAEIGRRLHAFQQGFPAAERRRSDPVESVHGYQDPDDQEVAALLASALAFGRAASLTAKVRTVLLTLGAHPAETVDRLQPGEIPIGLESVVHRWVSGKDLSYLLGGIRGLRKRHGNLGRAFLAGDDGGESLLAAMTAFAQGLRAEAPLPYFKRNRIPRGAAFLVPVPDGHAAAKRLCLFLRWMVRPADGLDLGLWTGISPARLTVPLDTHVARIGRYIGLTERSTAGWPMAREITKNLARFAPADPTSFDFPLSHLGIMGDCPRKQNPIQCAACDLVKVCRL